MPRVFDVGLNVAISCFRVVLVSKSGSKFYFQSGICMKTTRAVPGQATYVENKWLHQDKKIIVHKF